MCPDTLPAALASAAAMSMLDGAGVRLLPAQLQQPLLVPCPGLAQGLKRRPQKSALQEPTSRKGVCPGLSHRPGCNSPKGSWHVGLQSCGPHSCRLPCAACCPAQSIAFGVDLAPCNTSSCGNSTLGMMQRYEPQQQQEVMKTTGNKLSVKHHTDVLVACPLPPTEHGNGQHATSSQEYGSALHAVP